MVRIIKLFVDTPRLLQEKHIVKFSEVFKRGDTADFAGNYYRISNTQQVSFDRHWILPSGSNPPAGGTTNDYKDVTLSNAASGKENLYPDTGSELYEVLVGFEGDVLVFPQIPGSRYFYKLGYSDMLPDVTSTTKRYIGPWRAVDSPYYTPRLRFTFIHKLTPLKLRLYCDSADQYDKIIIRFLINRCNIQEIKPTSEEVSKARLIKYYTELSKGVE